MEKKPTLKSLNPNANIGHVATIQVLIPAIDANGNYVHTEAEAADFVSETLREAGFLDWSYLVLGGQILSPTERIYNEPYNEGDAFVNP